MAEFLKHRSYDDDPPPGSGAVRLDGLLDLQRVDNPLPGSGAMRLDDLLNPPPPPLSPGRQAFEAEVARVMQVRGLSRSEAESSRSRTPSSRISTPLIPTAIRAAAPIAASPRRRTRSCCRSALPYTTYGFTITAGRHGASADGQRRSPRSPRWESADEGEAPGRSGPYEARS